eukprot:jgi/Chlat1/6312/Chrsp44S05882
MEPPAPFSLFGSQQRRKQLLEGPAAVSNCLSLLSLLPASSPSSLSAAPFACASLKLDKRRASVEAAVRASVASLFAGRDVQQQRNPLQHIPKAASFFKNSVTSVTPSLASLSAGKMRLPFARIGATPAGIAGPRLEGVPVYAVVTGANEFLLVASMDNTVKLGFFCFSRADAEALLQEVKAKDPSVGRTARVEPVSLDKVYQLPKVPGVAFRFLPEARQVKNALEENKKKGRESRFFDGVPVFQSKTLSIRVGNQRYLPVFFAKEDLEKSLEAAHGKTPRRKGFTAPAYDIEVGVFENVLKMVEQSGGNVSWSEVVFIPPGQLEALAKMPANPF